MKFSSVLLKELFVANLPRPINESFLVTHFWKFGQINRAQIIRDPKTKQSKGYAFVGFVRDEDADAALAEMNQKQFKTFVMIVKPVTARSPNPNNQTTTPDNTPKATTPAAAGASSKP